MLNLSLILNWIYKIIFLVLLLAILMRFKTDSNSRSSGDLEIGVLLYGQFGTTLSLLSLFFLMRDKFRIKSFLYIFGFILGFITIFVSASRSPFIALILSSLLFVFFRKGGLSFLLITIVTSLILYFTFLDIVELIGQYFPNSFFTRLQYAFIQGNSGGRDVLLTQGIDELVDHPIFGNAMLLQRGAEKGSYPHNLIVEAFMATGVIGGVIFVMWIVKCLSSLKKIVQSNFDHSWIGLMFLQFLIFAMFSGNLYSSSLFWYTSVFLIAVANVKNFNSLRS